MTYYDYTAPEDVVERIGGAEIVIVNKVVLSKAVLSKCQNVKLISVLATGYNVIDIEYAKREA